MPHLDFVYSRTPTLPALGIRAMPPVGQWSHCSLLLPDGVTVVEALAQPPGMSLWDALVRRKGGVVRGTLPGLLARSSRWEHVRLPCPHPERGLTWALSTVGLEYDFGGAIGIPLRRRGMDKPDAWYCTEHCAQAAELSGARQRMPGAHGLTPTHLRQLQHAAGAWVVDAGIGGAA